MEKSKLRGLNSRYRPEGWNNPHPIPTMRIYDGAITQDDATRIYRIERNIVAKHEAFEAGADAMLEGLRKEGDKVYQKGWGEIRVPIKGEIKGRLVFIPDETEVDNGES